MINLVKQDVLKQLPDEDYQQWCYDMMIIKRVVTAITSFKQFTDLFDSRQYYYLPNHQQHRQHLNHEHFKMPYDDLRYLANDFLYALSVVRKIDQYYPLDYYPLHFQIFFECVQAHYLTRFDYDPGDFSPYFAKRLNDCAFDIHQYMRQPECKARLKQSAQLASRQQRSLDQYIDQLFLRYSRIVAVRVDFGYHENADASYELIFKHRELLLRYLREKHQGDAQVGYVWKLEYGLRKGYHLHMVIFLDGSRVQESISHGKIIANHRNEVITEGEGVAFNCNAVMDNYYRNGLGRVDYHDEEKIRDLKFACQYLTKYDEYIELMHYGYQANQYCDDPTRRPIYSELGRVFGKAKLSPYIPNLGRPRSRMATRF